MQKIKDHLHKHRELYIGVGIGVVIGGLTLGGLQNAQIIDSFKIQYKPSTINNITTQLARRGHPGNMVQCLETGEVFASQRRAAELLGISASSLGKHLNGTQTAVSGFHFNKLGEAA